LRTAIVVIHQLPETSETLWLRLLGRGSVQEQALIELQALPLVESRGDIIPRPSQLDPDVPISVHPAPDVLGYSPLLMCR
jgi:hypothetical protein